MPRLDALMDQEKPLRILAGILARGDIPHAFLFTGIDGIGKRSAAMGFAMACNCLAAVQETSLPVPVPGDGGLPFCGDCRICRAIAAGTHPDVITIAPEGNAIKIGRIRELIEKVVFRPHEARMRAVIVSDAWAMNPEAANALLKSLEEPPPQTIFFLTAEHASDLLPTVVSRCRHIRFAPVAADRIETFLHQRHGVDAKAARSAALMSGGSVARALALTDVPLGAWRQWLAAELAALPSRPVPLVLAFAEKLQKNKDQVGQWLGMIQTCLYDAVVWKYQPGRIMNIDMADAVAAMSDQESIASLGRKIDAVVAVEKALDRNVNPRLATEKLALELANRL